MNSAAGSQRSPAGKRPIRRAPCNAQISYNSVARWTSDTLCFALRMSLGSLLLFWPRHQSSQQSSGSLVMPIVLCVSRPLTIEHEVSNKEHLLRRLGFRPAPSRLIIPRLTASVRPHNTKLESRAHGMCLYCTKSPFLLCIPTPQISNLTSLHHFTALQHTPRPLRTQKTHSYLPFLTQSHSFKLALPFELPHRNHAHHSPPFPPPPHPPLNTHNRLPNDNNNLPHHLPATLQPNAPLPRPAQTPDRRRPPLLRRQLHRPRLVRHLAGERVYSFERVVRPLLLLSHPIPQRKQPFSPS